uniref:Uncharacterized protein n=1 Tax=Panagrolaimus sp. ES5 TaxID=591445 RepID=A0AC34FBC1_9BILA
MGNLYNLMMTRFEIFKLQDPENGKFDVVFEVEGKEYSEIIADDRFFMLSKQAVKEIIESLNRDRKYFLDKSEELKLKVVYEWAEMQAKNKLSSDKTLNLKEKIKEEFSEDLMALFNFEKMDKSYIDEFFVSKAFLFTDSQLNVIKSKAYNTYNIEITDHLEDDFAGTLKGKLHCEIGDKIFEAINSLDDDEKIACHISDYANDTEFTYYYWPTNCKLPLTPSTLKANVKRPTTPSEKDDIDSQDEEEDKVLQYEDDEEEDNYNRFLIIDEEGDVGLKYGTALNDKDYLLAKMFDNSNFRMLENSCKIKIFR